MEFQSIIQYLGKKVLITLENKFWYRAVINSVSDGEVTFTEEKGKKITVSPKAILIIEEI